jgi:uncharacterized protein (DUF1810 family)
MKALEMYDLQRFVSAQEDNYGVALSELRRGRKVTHWIWYVFPQLRAIGFSERSKFYGIEDIYEARAYLDDPILGPRYLTCVATLLIHEGQKINDIMGNVDEKKLLSSLTLMDRAGGGDLVHKAIKKFYFGKKCEFTERLLNE